MMIQVGESCLTRQRLLLGASLIALSAAPWISQSAQAACGTTISSTTTVTGSVSCLDWTGGDLTISSSGSVAGGTTGISITTGNTPANLVNNGTISASEYAINANGGSITTIINSGLINSSSDYAINVTGDGTIASIVNDTNGNISGTFGVAVGTGTVNSVVNRGTIRGTTNHGLAVGTSGHVGSATNESTGLITGNTGLFVIGGTLGTLTNNGTISGTSKGIVLTSNGTINTITNNGLISGPQAVSIASGSIGLLTNTGTIAGSITNGSTTGLTISGGGSSSAYGLFTGSSGGTASGDIGQITHTASDLTLNSGYIWLNDNINVTGHKVQVNNATVKMSNAISVTGDYTQTGGGLLSTIASNSQYGSLDVSGQANISNTTLVLQGSNLQAGDTYTIVSVGNTSGSSSITSASVVGTSGLSATVSGTGGNLVVTLSSGSEKYAPIGTSEGGAAAALGSVLDRINGLSTPEAQAFQSDVLAVIDSLSTDAEKGSAIKQLLPVNAANTMQMSSQSTSIVLNAIETRQLVAMGGDGGYHAGTGKAAGSDVADSALWGQFLGGSSHLSESSDNDGFRSKSFGLTSGFDHRINPNLLGGAALSWLRSWVDGSNDSSGSSQTLDSYQLTLYGTYRLDRLSIDGQAGAGWNHFDQTRNIDFLGGTASADYDGQQYMARAKAGYDLSVDDNTTLTPFAGLRWVHARNESYEETGAGAANTSVNAQNSDSVTQELGATVSWQLDTDYGLLTPELSAAWIHDYTDSSMTSSGEIGGVAYSIDTEGLPSDGARIGVALSLATLGSGDLRFAYDGELRSGYQSQIATLKASWNF